MKCFALTGQRIAVASLRESLQDPATGACACFEGVVRNHHQGRAVTSLTYQAYTALAESEGEAIIREALQKFDIAKAYCEHRTGELKVADTAVWIGVSSAHRESAFSACRWIIDEVKQRLPIWKHEHYSDGSDAWQHPLTPR